MPIYEFRCESCGCRFEQLVEVGTETVSCGSCGAERTTRVYSAQGAPFKLVQTGSDLRRQERSNSKLRERARRRPAARRDPTKGPNGGRT